MEKAELLPQIDAAIALLRAEVTELRLGNRDHCLHKLVAADSAPLPAAQFEGLLVQWKPPAVPAELLELMRQLEEMDRKAPPPDAAEEKKNEEVQSVEDDDVEADDASAESVDEETDASGKEDEPATQEKEDEEAEDNSSIAANEKAGESSNEDGDAPPEELEEDEEAAMQRKQREADAQAALLKLQTLRKSMMLDVLSKIVSVAKSKGVVRLSSLAIGLICC